MPLFIYLLGYFTTNSSEDWDIASEICELASLNERMATEAATVLRRELKYADPRAQLSAARVSPSNLFEIEYLLFPVMGYHAS